LTGPCCCVPLVCLLHRQVLSNACDACLLSKQMQGARKGVDVLSQNGSLSPLPFTPTQPRRPEALSMNAELAYEREQRRSVCRLTYITCELQPIIVCFASRAPWPHQGAASHLVQTRHRNHARRCCSKRRCAEEEEEKRLREAVRRAPGRLVGRLCTACTRQCAPPRLVSLSR
jgi:hypothetical protein